LLFQTLDEYLRPPLTIDHTQPEKLYRALEVWAEVLSVAVNEADAWAILGTRPDGDIMIFDVSPDGIRRCAQWSAEARLVRPEPGWDSPPPLPT